MSENWDNLDKRSYHTNWNTKCSSIANEKWMILLGNEPPTYLLECTLLTLQLQVTSMKIMNENPTLFAHFFTFTPGSAFFPVKAWIYSRLHGSFDRQTRIRVCSRLDLIPFLLPKRRWGSMVLQFSDTSLACDVDL